VKYEGALSPPPAPAPMGCSTVIVVNDHTAAAMQRLRNSLEFRRRRRPPRIALLTYLPEAADALELMIRAVTGPSGPTLSLEQIAALLGGAPAGPLTARDLRDAVTFEYQC
jgi:hypothetical protein